DREHAPGLQAAVHEKMTRIWGTDCVVRGEFAAAEKAFRVNLGLAGRGEDEGKLEVLSKLVVALRAQGKNAEALATHLRVLSAQQRQLELVREFGSDPVMEQFLDNIEDHLDMLINLLAAGNPDPETVGLLWSWVVRHKGVVLDA